MARVREIRRRRAGAVAAGLLLTALTSSVVIAIGQVDPPSGTVTQGEAISASIHLSSALSCVSATVDDPTIVVMLDGLATAACGSGSRQVMMAVQTSPLTQVGLHVITLTEVDSVTLDTDTVIWNLDVVASATTTLPTVPTTTTTLPVVTSTTSTTTPPTTETTSPPPTLESTTTTPSSITTDPQAAPITTEGSNSPPTPTTSLEDESDNTTSTTTELVAGSLPTPPTQADGSSDSSPDGGTALWEQIRRALVPVFPPRIADLIVSPLLIAEVVFAAMLGASQALVVPTLAVGAVAGWGLWRIARRADSVAERISFLS